MPTPGWGERDAKVSLAGKALAPGTDVATGLVHTLEGTDLVVWLKRDLSRPAKITISG